MAPSSSPAPGRWPWLLAIAFGLALGLGWWLLLPTWSAPDEPGHYLYTRLLADLGRRPLIADLGPAVEAPLLHSLADQGWWPYLGHLTPDPLPPRLSADPTLAASGLQAADEPLLFYILPAFVLRRLPASLAGEPAQALRWLRLWPLTLRLGAVLVALWLAQHSWPQQPARVLGLGLLAGGLPMVAFIGGSLNNDALALFWGALAFALVALPEPVTRFRLLLTAVVVAVGPIWVDAGLIYLWPLALVRLAWGRSRSRMVWLGIAALILALVAPVPRWAAGWRRQPTLALTRSDQALAVQPAPGQTTRLVQHIAGKQALALRGREIELIATSQDPADANLTFTLRDDNHTAHLACTPMSQSPCRLDFTPAASATFLRIEVQADQSKRFHLRLQDSSAGGSNPNLIFNGDGALPDRLGSPLFLYLERWLPVPAGYFAQALAHAAWDTPSQFRYLLFSGLTWASFWGYFGWLNRPFPWPVYGVLGAATLAAGWGLFRLFTNPSFRDGLANRPPPSPVKRPVNHKTIPLLPLALIATILLLMQVWLPMIGQSWQPQGRYLFPGLLPIAIMLLIGWEAALPVAWRPRLPLLLAAGLISLNLIAWRIIA